MQNLGVTMVKQSVFVAILALAGCETIENNSELFGAGVGALVGGAACAVSSANDTECALLVLGGAAAGFAIASYIDKDDEDAYRLATNDVLNEGKSSSTRVSSVTGNSITATRIETGTTSAEGDSTDCQTLAYDYTTDFEQEFCKNADGAWVRA